MYSTCLYCHRPLGANTRVEAFPVGERLAFDPERGRLWAVCRSCARWNLSPVEERWEALEQCERLFRDTPRRTTTENIGMARPADGPVLIRVGRPLRPEFAAWRYAPQLERRRRNDLLRGGLIAASHLGVLVVGAATLGTAGFAVAAAAPLVFVGSAVAWSRSQLQRVVGLTAEGSPVRVRHLRDVRLQGAGEEMRVVTDSDDGHAELTGAAAQTLASVACARSNQVGASPRYVRSAVESLERSGGPAAVLDAACRAEWLTRIRYVDRLALEMALHEEQERRAMEGELRTLEAAWREAEEIAAIADGLAMAARRADDE
ncbi:MAG TPA: hypothetical protein VK420_07585 [Longimicrobium sp.]|nr:hypothetical protein [Longimicrobium sp.]